ncbi:hypothetical protein WHX55_15740 [Pseudomonas fluorescens]|uniref:hypothetical protein n=1 Tax=Pseudomonas fluorescens TaxID=294 RepID=UPI00324827C4
MNNFTGQPNNPDAHLVGYIPPFNNLTMTINFTACLNLPTRKAMVYTLLERHLVDTHLSTIDAAGWTGPLAVEAQAFLNTIAPGAILTSICNDGYVK